MNKLLLVLPKKDLYYFNHIDENKINVSYTYKKLNWFAKIIRKMDLILIHRLHINISFLNKYVCKLCYDKKIIQSIKNDSGIAILDYYLGEDLLLLVKKLKCKKFYLLIWNALDDYTIAKYKKYIDCEHIYSYSYEDCKKYGLNHFNDFYLTDYPIVVPDTCDYDMYFMGSDKNRNNLLESFIKTIEGNFSYEFELYVPNLGELKNKINGISYFDEYMPFDEYIKKIIRSRCLLDLNNHYNITYRTIEAVIFKKKYITNNTKILSMDLYNPNNMFVINDETTADDIYEFMAKPFVEIDKSIIEKYDVYYTYNLFNAKVMK